MASGVVSNYRFILKHVKSLPSASNWRGHVVTRFQQGRAETDQSRIVHLRSVASQYVNMVRSINELKHLRGLDTGEKLDPRDKIRATANRVGLSVPRFADDALPDHPSQPADEAAFSNRKSQ